MWLVVLQEKNDEMSSNKSRCDSNDSSKAQNVVKEYENLKMKNKSPKQKPKSKVSDLILSNFIIIINWTK